MTKRLAVYKKDAILHLLKRAYIPQRFIKVRDPVFQYQIDPPCNRKRSRKRATALEMNFFRWQCPGRVV
jgi:hypothetical protein